MVFLLFLPFSNLVSSRTIETQSVQPDQVDYDYQTPVEIFTITSHHPDDDDGEKTDVEVKIIKSFEDSEPIYLKIQGHHFGVEDLGNVFFKLVDPTGEIIEDIQLSQEGFILREFEISPSQPIGVYILYVNLGPIPEREVGCCRNFNFRLSWAGLSLPPVINSVGKDFGYTPHHGYLTLINSQGNDILFSFYGKAGEDYTLEHQPWAEESSVSSYTITKPGGSTIKPDGIRIRHGLEKFEFSTNETGIHFIDANMRTGPRTGALTGHRLVMNTDEAFQVIPLFFGTYYNRTDSDLDLLPDSQEKETNSYSSDTDEDNIPDNYEIILGGDPTSEDELPFKVSGVYAGNVGINGTISYAIDIEVLDVSPDIVVNSVNMSIKPPDDQIFYPENNGNSQFVSGDDWTVGKKFHFNFSTLNQDDGKYLGTEGPSFVFQFDTNYNDTKYPFRLEFSQQLDRGDTYRSDITKLDTVDSVSESPTIELTTNYPLFMSLILSIALMVLIKRYIVKIKGR